ncbi:MAG: hypothetical protein QM572_06075 [Nocardioides sp.]|uniref:hypothetical protein n=1 Tax=Nocardioides sp. TaxID=35761 RepID=UPI0039E33131
MSAVLAWLVGIIDVAQFLPQAGRTVGQRHDHRAMRSLSIPTWTIATIQGTAWVVYGMGTHHYAVGVPNLIITPICATILALRLRSARATRRGPSERSAAPAR